MSGKGDGEVPRHQAVKTGRSGQCTTDAGSYIITPPSKYGNPGQDAP